MFTGNDFAGAMKAARNLVYVLFIAVVCFILALCHRIDVQAQNEQVAKCIINNVDYRPPEGLRTYCERLNGIK